MMGIQKFVILCWFSEMCIYLCTKLHPNGEKHKKEGIDNFFRLSPNFPCFLRLSPLRCILLLWYVLAFEICIKLQIFFIPFMKKFKEKNFHVPLVRSAKVIVYLCKYAWNSANLVLEYFHQTFLFDDMGQSLIIDCPYCRPIAEGNTGEWRRRSSSSEPSSPRKHRTELLG